MKQLNKHILMTAVIFTALIYTALGAWDPNGPWDEKKGKGDASMVLLHNNTIADSTASYYDPSNSITIYWKESYQDDQGIPGGSDGNVVNTTSYSINNSFASADYNTAGHYVSDDSYYRYSYSNHWGFTDVY